MQHSYIYKFENILLKPLLDSDIEYLRILRNKEKKYFFTQSEITKEMQNIWYQKYLDRDDDIMFKIVKEKEPEVFIGAVALYKIDKVNKISEFGRIVVDKELAPEKGVGLMATKAICRFGFECLNLNRIKCEAFKFNERIIKVYKRAGFYIVDEEADIINFEISYKTLKD